MEGRQLRPKGGPNMSRRMDSALCKTGIPGAKAILQSTPCLLLCLVILSSAWGESGRGDTVRTWKTLSELSSEELAQVDLRSETPRQAEYLYLPAEPYPFTPPYTAEEMGYRMMEFTQRPRWSCVYANLFGSISSQGSLLGQGQAVNLVEYPAPEGTAGELARKPGEEVYRQLTQHLFPPESYGSQNLLIRYRTDQGFTKKEDQFGYTLSLRRVRHQNQIRRGDK